MRTPCFLAHQRKNIKKNKNKHLYSGQKLENGVGAADVKLLHKMLSKIKSHVEN
jgi:hypothetical protein